MTSPPEPTTIRVLYSDLHGVARGKDIPATELNRVADRGLCFCAAVMSTDLRHTPVIGGEAGYPDLHAFPDLHTCSPSMGAGRVRLPGRPAPRRGPPGRRRPARPRPPRRRAAR